MDSGGRATQEAKAESRSLRGVNEGSRTELMPLSRKKCIFRNALKLGIFFFINFRRWLFKYLTEQLFFNCIF